MAFFVSCSERVAMKFGIATGHCGQHTVPQQGELASATKLKETESKKCGKEVAPDHQVQQRGPWSSNGKGSHERSFDAQ
jgi:hypothetical protein